MTGWPRRSMLWPLTSRGVQAKLAAEIVRQCGVSLERIFYDLTSLLFYTQTDTPEQDQNGQPSLSAAGAEA